MSTVLGGDVDFLQICSQHVQVSRFYPCALIAGVDFSVFGKALLLSKTFPNFGEALPPWTHPFVRGRVRPAQLWLGPGPYQEIRWFHPPEITP